MPDHTRPRLAQLAIDAAHKVEETAAETTLRPMRRNTTSAPSSPAARTGPPSSFFFPRTSSQISTSTAKGKGKTVENGLGLELPTPIEEFVDPYRQSFVRSDSGFRGAWEYDDPEKEKEKEGADGGGARVRESWLLDPETWNPRKWFGFTEDDAENANATRRAESPQEETTKPEAPESIVVTSPGGSTRRRPLRSTSLPGGTRNPVTAPRWRRLRSLLPSIAAQGQGQRPGASSVSQPGVSIVDELTTSGLSGVMLRMWSDRDEKGRRRVPILLHRLRVRISDSIHPLHNSKAAFRIECEYANGAARWVVYRQLRDFYSLHNRYRYSLHGGVARLPQFPRHSKPYFNLLRREGHTEMDRAAFARLQREELENYLIGLIKAVMFLPSANRLCRFLEVSALSIALANSGGSQLKAGVMRVEPYGKNKSTWGRKGLGWKEKKASRWCAVRDSYIVTMEEAGELKVYDVFLLDEDFKIERPKRYYRQGLRVMHLEDDEDNDGIISSKHAHHRSHHTHHDRQNNTTTSTNATTLTAPEKSDERRGSFSTLKSGILSRLRSIGSTHKGTVNGTVRSRRSSTSSTSSSSSSTTSSTHGAAAIDPSTNRDPLWDGTVTPGEGGGTGFPDEGVPKDSKKKKKKLKDVSKHTFYVKNSQMKLRLVAKNERQMHQWIAALERMATSSHWSGSNRFGSFAPIRLNVAAQWLVDGRDYFWSVARAIQVAREKIYIHDWWLSPELNLRRPGKPAYRLDRLLKRKAEEGVKIYVIVYKEVSNRTTPTDSNYTKQLLTSLHPNIMVQRSPSHFATGTFYWAHHEKMCVIDEAIAFMGGVDLCFGRWDTPQHVLVDDGDPNDPEGSQIWIGKDYSNPRVTDFHNLNRPEQDMYDRSKVPRMPWHDIGMQIIGQPARDLCRHFVQRWNFLLRVKKHSRSMPFLLPPPDFKASELTEQGLTGTCELQICRSAGPWSLGTPDRVERSIQNAYLKAIQLSEHFVYIENQFFITSTVVGDVPVENQIGDALVSRIIRAHREKTPWKAVIVIPLLPGFTFPVDHSEASAIRLILECQNRTISRGPHSIFTRLRKENIDPDDYITFFSLRSWAKLPNDVLTSEQVYIHAKIMIVDDRLAIIGSANINDRSQKGDRDSELAAVIRDLDMIDGTMAGKPFKVGRFAHTLRVRLMREHLGVDVDALWEEDLLGRDPVVPEHEVEVLDPDKEQTIQENVTGATDRTAAGGLVSHATSALDQVLTGSAAVAASGIDRAARKMGLQKDRIDDESLEAERKMYDREGKEQPGFAGSIVPTLEEKTVAEHRPEKHEGKDKPLLDDIPEADAEQQEDGNEKELPPQARVKDGSHELYGAPADASTSAQTDNQPPHQRSGKDDADEQEKAAPPARAALRRHLSVKVGAKPWTMPTPAPKIDPYGFDDPLDDSFFKDMWVAAAVHNTEIFRKVFHAIPDDLVTTWKQYKEFIVHHERLLRPQNKDTTAGNKEPIARVPSETGARPSGEPTQEGRIIADGSPAKEDETSEKVPERLSTDQLRSDNHSTSALSGPMATGSESGKKPANPNEPFEPWEIAEMEELLRDVKGHLVIYPTRFLEGEDIANNFLFNADRLLPIPIYD